MQAFTAQFLADDFERVFVDAAARALAAAEPNQVEILTAGTRRMVFVNGQRIDRVLDIQLPAGIGEIGPVIAMKFVAKQIMQREVSGEEFKKLQCGA